LAWFKPRHGLIADDVPAAAMHELIDRAEARVLSDYPDLADFVPPRSPSTRSRSHRAEEREGEQVASRCSQAEGRQNGAEVVC